MKRIYEDYLSRRSIKTKLDFARDTLELIGAGGIIKKHNCALVKLPKFPELGKLEARDTLPLSDMFTLLSLEMNCSKIMWLVEMKDQLTSTYRATLTLVEMNNQLTDTCHVEMRLLEIIQQDELSYFKAQQVLKPPLLQCYCALYCYKPLVALRLQHCKACL